MPEAAPWSRQTLLRVLRLLHQAEAVNQLSFDLPPGARWSGDAQAGSFRFSSGSGDDLAAVWDANRAVVVVFDHESPRSAIGNDDLDPETAWEPRANFGPPEDYEDLLGRAVKLLEEGDQNVTAGVWGAGDEVFASEPFVDAVRHGINWVEPFPSEAEELKYLTTTRSMDEARARLTQSLVDRAPCTLEEAERSLLLDGARPGGEAAARLLFEQIGVRWE